MTPETSDVCEFLVVIVTSSPNKKNKKGIYA
jgi:hypothetical protein